MVELVLRCRLPDRPGALASLAGALGRAGGDIQAVDVVGHAHGEVWDDLVVVARDHDHAGQLLAAVRTVDGVALVHAGPSRGDPGDAVTRFAIGLEALLIGTMAPDHALPALLGGAVRASSAELVDDRGAEHSGRHTLDLPFGDRRLRLHREYRFTETERGRAEALLRVAVAALRARDRPRAAEQ